MQICKLTAAELLSDKIHGLVDLCFTPSSVALLPLPRRLIFLFGPFDCLLISKITENVLSQFSINLLEGCRQPKKTPLCLGASDFINVARMLASYIYIYIR